MNAGRYGVAAGLVAGSMVLAIGPGMAHPRNDYPTAARVDYVIGCLMDHQFKHQALEPCACKVDVIADQLTYEEFDQAITVIGVQRNGGMGRANEMFRDTPVARQTKAKFDKAQEAAGKACPFLPDSGEAASQGK